MTRILLVLLTMALLATQVMASSQSLEAVASFFGTTEEKLLKSSALIPGDSQSDWAALLAGRLGQTEYADDYLNQMWDYVSRQYQENGGLDSVKATVWHRTALTLLALGADPTCFGEDAQGGPIDLIADGVYGWDTTDSLGTQGLNGWIFALLTLDAGGYRVPETASYTREDMITAILEAQEPEGGFGLSAGLSDVDITAMALQALAPYREDYSEEIEGALAYLSQAQTARGDFENQGMTSAESCAQVIVALCALNIDPRMDARFVKEGGSAVDGLLLYRTEDGSFSHNLGQKSNLLATEQAGLALCALERMNEGKTALYDFSDVSLQVYVPKESSLLLYVACAAGVLLVAGLVILWVRKGRKQCTK